MGKVVALRPVERVCEDGEPVALIYRNMGSVAAEQVVLRALSELAIALSVLMERVEGRNFADLPRQVRRVQRMADQLGLVTLSQVARDLQQVVEAGDTHAFAAVWARLSRVAERSLHGEAGAADRIR